ncbi:MAG: ROK family protein [Chloroflexota bacterium]
MEQTLIGLDIGGTKTEALLVNETLTPQTQLRQPTTAKHPERLLANLITTIDKAVAQAKVHPRSVTGIGIGIPGQVNPETGEVKTAVNLNIDRLALGRMLNQTYGIPIFVDNDMHTAAQGIYHYLNQHGESVSSLAYLGIGTGIAAGIILNGELHSGQQQMAGEIGHIVFQEDGPRCKCGQHGCLEAIASGPAIVAQANKIIDGYIIHTPKDLYDLADTGYFPAQLAVTRISKSIARAIQLLLLTYDVEKVVIGGGVARLGDQLLQPILKELNQLQQQSLLARRMLAPAKVTVIPADFNPGLWGAIHLAQQGLQRIAA